MTAYQVKLAPSAARAFRKLTPEMKTRVSGALEKLASAVGAKGRIGGKAVRTIVGTKDSFHRLRVGDHRVMFDVIEQDRVILVLGIVDRADLERWLRDR